MQVQTTYFKKFITRPRSYLHSTHSVLYYKWVVDLQFPRWVHCTEIQWLHVSHRVHVLSVIKAGWRHFLLCLLPKPFRFNSAQKRHGISTNSSYPTWPPTIDPTWHPTTFSSTQPPTLVFVIIVLLLKSTEATKNMRGFYSVTKRLQRNFHTQVFYSSTIHFNGRIRNVETTVRIQQHKTTKPDCGHFPAFKFKLYVTTLVTNWQGEHLLPTTWSDETLSFLISSEMLNCFASLSATSIGQFKDLDSSNNHCYTERDMVWIRILFSYIFLAQSLFWSWDKCFISFCEINH